MSEKQLKSIEKKSNTANGNLQKFIILISRAHSLYLSSGGLETEHQGKISDKITSFPRARTTIWSRNTKNNLLNSRKIKKGQRITFHANTSV